MRSKHLLQAGAGFLALASFGLLFSLYGGAVLSSFRLPLPSLAFGLGRMPGSGLQASADTSNPRIIIPKLNLSAPVVKDVSVSDENEYKAALKTGVALAKGSAELEAWQGNSFIFGHSSNFLPQA